MGIINRVKSLFRPIYVPIISKKNELYALLKFEQFLSRHQGSRAFVIGSPIYSNIGDSAILLAQIRFIRKCGYTSDQIKEITSKEYNQYRSLLTKQIKSDELILGLGGGNMGNQWPAEEQIRENLIEDYSDSNIIFFPQTICFVGGTDDCLLCAEEMEENYKQHRNITLVARETKSYEIMKTLFLKATILLTPDIVLCSTMEDYGAVQAERSGVLFVTRSDPEKAVSDETWEQLEKAIAKNEKSIRKTDMYSDTPVTKENRAECVRKKMQEFCAAELVITDRLHGMVFAALTGTPCIVFSNYNHKVKGTYEWISYLPYIRYCESAEEAETAIPELLSMKDCHFDNTPLLPHFEKLAEVIKKYAANNRYRSRL